MRVLSVFLILFALLSISHAQQQLSMESDNAARFISAHGRRAWVAGYGNGGLEVWTEALQIASDIHPEFRRAGDATVVPGTQIARAISNSPSHVSRIYIGPDFTVEEQLWVPLDQQAVLLRYIVRSVDPLQIIVRFRPSLNLMWPASLGGQEIHWDATKSAYVFTDSAHQFAAAMLVPGASAHDEPLNSVRPLPQTDELAVALDARSPQVLFARLDPHDLPGSLDHVQPLLQSAPWQQRSETHYRDLLASHLQIETPDAELDRALAWAEITLDQDWFCNDPLGCAYVAGYGPSRRNRRPQYAWFFAGDGMIALHAAMAEGDLERARDEIRFIAKYQDPESGMIWHELSQSAPYIDWRGKYPYMYVHADLTYPYISTIADYVRSSNDRALLRELWPSIQKAYAYGRSLIAADGLPRIPLGKEGSDEQNALTDEAGLSASWVAACADYAHLADLMGDNTTASDAHALAARARAAFTTRYWDEQRNFPIEGYRVNGEPMPGRGLGALDAVNGHLLTDTRSAHVLDEISTWRFQSDWGTRSIAMGDPGFDPNGYGHGSVWAVGTDEAADALWTAHRPDVAWQAYRTLIPWSSLDSLGHMDEVLAGDTYHAQVESVPEQTWSSASFLSSAVRGLFGLQPDSEDGVLTFAPHLPSDWDIVKLRGVRMRDARIDLSLTQQLDGMMLHIENSGEPVRMRFDPQVPLGAHDVVARFQNRKLEARLDSHAQEQSAAVEFTAPHGASEIALKYRGGISVVMPAPHPSLGHESRGMKLTSVAFNHGSLTIGLDAIASQDNRLQLRTPLHCTSARNARMMKISDAAYELTIAPTTVTHDDSYTHQEVTVTCAQ